MAKSRGWCSHQTSPPPPPPPYEASNNFCMEEPTQTGSGQRSTSTSNYQHAHSDLQTIPKTAHHSSHRMLTSSHERTRDSSLGDLTKQQIKTYHHNQPRLPCAHHSNRKHSASSGHHRGSDNHDQFVRSLAAPRSFWSHISVEPLAFLAIVALYIEFPAIQDLIWTKICLEVTSQHPNLSQPILATQSLPISNNSLQQPPQVQAGNSSNSINGTNYNLAIGNMTQTLLGQNSLPADGRIRPPSTQANLTNYQVITNASLNNNNNNNNHNSSRRQHLLCDRMNSRSFPSEIRQEIIDVDSLFWLKYQLVICSLCMLASPYWGGLSDKIGRLIPMNVPMVAAILCNSISLAFGLLISLNSHSLFHIEWLYLGAVIVGLSGGQTVLIMNLFSFISDNTTSEQRSRRVTILESVIFVAHSLGFFLNKLITTLGLNGPDRPWLNRHFVAFGSCVLLNLIGILYSSLMLRHRKFHRFLNNFEREQQEAAIMGSNEQIGNGASGSSGPSATMGSSATGATDSAQSTQLQMSMPGERLRELTSNTPDDPDGPIARSDKSNWNFRDSLITIRYYRETYEIATKKRDSRTIIMLLLLSTFISALSLTTLMSLMYIYSRMDPFNWATSDYSWWNSVSSITRGIALITLTLFMRFVSGWNVPDPMVAAVGFLAKGAGMLTIGLAQSAAHLNWSLVAFTFSEYTMPPIRSLLSKLVVREELGKLYSCVGALQGFSFILGNLAFYAAFTIYTDQQLFRLSFVVIGCIEFGAVILLLIIYTAIRRQLPQILL